MDLEAVTMISTLAVILIAGSRIPSRPLRKWEFVFDAVARRRGISVALVFLAALTMRGALLRWAPTPEPRIHDEFSHLLLADTFASGRIANPPHPMWKHFETFHVIQQPSYASMYPVAQGMVLALGQVLTGNPWVGVLFSAAAMCAAICWMLQGWLPPRWALLAGLMAAIRLATFSYWANSYYGGAVAATAGALVLGGMRRIQLRASWGGALVMAVGLALLANTRPYEGLIFSVPVIIALLLQLRKGSRQKTTYRVVAPIALTLTLTFCAMGYYFWRVTGSPFRMPYEVNRKTYAMAPYFLFQHLRPRPAYLHPAMEKFYADMEVKDYLERRSVPGWIRYQWSKAKRMFSFYFGPALALALLLLPWMWRDRRIRFPLWVGAVMLLGTAPETWTYMHYIAPGTAVVYLIVAQAMRHLRTWGRRCQATGFLLAWSMPLICVAMLGVRTQQQRDGILPTWFAHNWANGVHGPTYRARIQRELEQRPGQHLVVVRYRPDHIVNNEWVYNAADPDRAEVIWAREMDPVSNAELIRYFKERQVWLLEADAAPPQLSPFPQATTVPLAPDLQHADRIHIADGEQVKDMVTRLVADSPSHQ